MVRLSGNVWPRSVPLCSSNGGFFGARSKGRSGIGRLMPRQAAVLLERVEPSCSASFSTQKGRKGRSLILRNWPHRPRRTYSDDPLVSNGHLVEATTSLRHFQPPRRREDPPLLKICKRLLVSSHQKKGTKLWFSSLTNFAVAKSPPSRVLGAPRENRILPPPDKSVRLAGLSPVGAGHMPHRTRSDNTLPQVNKEEAPGRDRAWTTTDVRPRINPVSVRTELSPTIEIVQTSPTPTNGPSPVRQKMGHEDRSYVRDAIYVEDEHASVVMWEQHSSRQSKRSNRPSTAPLLSSGEYKAPERPSKGTRDAPASPHLYQSSLPGVPEVHATGTNPMVASHPQQSIETTVSSLDSPTSSVDIDMGEPLMRITTEPLEMTPSAVDLHNLHFNMSGELENLSYMPQGVRIDNGGTYGFNGARGLGTDKSWGILGPPADTIKSSPTKARRITGFFSRKKR